MGLQRPTGGEIRFGGVAQSQADGDAWRRCFSLLLQRQQLFTGTLRDNLRLARPDADDDTLWRALEQARLADLVHRRGGLDLWIGTEGCTCPEARAGASPWPGCCCATARWCCSTSRSPAWSRPPPTPCSKPCKANWRTGC